MLLLKIFIVILLILFPFGEVIRFDLGNDIFFKPLDIIVGLLSIWIIILFIKNKSLGVSLKWYYFLFPFVGLFSLVVNSYWLKSNELLTSFLYWFRWISYMSVFFAVMQLDEKFKKKIIPFLLVDGFFVVLIGYLQLFFYPSLRDLFYLGWDEHLYRMFSTFLDPNFVGAFFVLYLIFVAGLLFHNNNKISKRKKIIYSLFIGLTLIAIFLTYSRSALLMLIFSGSSFFLLLQRKKFILFLFGAIVVFILIISPFFYLENINLFRVNSSIARLAKTQSVLRIIQNQPLLGVGFDTYRYAQIRYGFISLQSPFPSHSAAGVDTSLLFVVATTGVIGLTSYGYLWFRLFVKAKDTYKQNPYALVFIASGIGLFINSIFINSLFFSEIMFWMWIITGLVVNG